MNLDSQFTHFDKGDCSDDAINFIDLYCEKAKEKSNVKDLMNCFDGTHAKLGATVFSKQFAKGEKT